MNLFIMPFQDVLNRYGKNITVLFFYSPTEKMDNIDLKNDFEIKTVE